jgi:hypothetical protein
LAQSFERNLRRFPTPAWHSRSARATGLSFSEDFRTQIVREHIQEAIAALERGEIDLCPSTSDDVPSRC